MRGRWVKAAGEVGTASPPTNLSVTRPGFGFVRLSGNRQKRRGLRAEGSHVCIFYKDAGSNAASGEGCRYEILRTDVFFPLASQNS